MSKQLSDSYKTVSKSDKPMSSAAIMKEAVVYAAGPRDWNDTRESWLARAARKLGVSHRRAKSLFYGTARTITGDEILAAAKLMQDRRNARQKESHETVGEMLRLLGVTKLIDGDFSGPLGDVARHASPQVQAARQMADEG